MQNAYPVGGAMMAVLGLDADVISKVCDETEGIVSIANDNCPGQIVITGEEAAVKCGSKKMCSVKCRRTFSLKASRRSRK